MLEARRRKRIGGGHDAMGERFEVLIVGSGPAGLAAGVDAAARGLSHVVLERGELANTIHRYQKRKHVMAEPQRLRSRRGSRLIEAGRGDPRGPRRRGGGPRGLHRGPGFEVRTISGSLGDFQVGLANGESLSCARVVLAVGLQGNLNRFAVPGADLPHVTYQLDDPADHTGKRIVVVGVGDAGIENALALVETENEVAIVNRTDEIDRAKAANKAAIEAISRRAGLPHPRAGRRFEPSAVVRQTKAGSVRLGVDLVIGRIGASPAPLPRGPGDRVPLQGSRRSAGGERELRDERSRSPRDRRAGRLPADQELHEPGLRGDRAHHRESGRARGRAGPAREVRRHPGQRRRDHRAIQPAFSLRRSPPSRSASSWSIPRCVASARAPRSTP
jgi:cation diffusion facilitator CzcD-associated flavoprotein CzcO